MSYEIEIDGEKIKISEEELQKQMARRAKPSSTYDPVMKDLFDPEKTYENMLTNIGFTMYISLEDYEIYHNKYLGVAYTPPEEHDELTALPLFSPHYDWEAHRKSLEGNEEILQEYDQHCKDYKDYMQQLALERAKQNLDENSKNKVLALAELEASELQEEACDKMELYRDYTVAKCDKMQKKYKDKLEKEQRVADNYEEILEELAEELENDKQEDTVQMFQSYYYNYQRSLRKISKLETFIQDIEKMRKYSKT